MYIHQLQAWPNFTWDHEKVFRLLADIVHRQGRLLGRMEGLGFRLQAEASLQAMTLEIIQSNEIEGQLLDAAQVRSSIARRLGIEIAGLVSSDRHVEGVVEMILDATQHFDKPLSKERVCGWQSALFPMGYSGIHKIVVGAWRDNEPEAPMQVVSGAMGKERIHFEAPSADNLDREMQNFFNWFNGYVDIPPILKAAIAHLWFVTIHPFDDGNGRIARTIADMQLARADGTPQRFYSMSSQIKIERNDYYTMLEKTQKGSLDITPWLEWFMGCLDRALVNADTITKGVVEKARYWEMLATKNLNDRQRRMVNKLLDGFTGKLNTSKWAIIAKCSHDTALRDIQDLVNQAVLRKESGGGRSTTYALVPHSEWLLKDSEPE